MKKHKETQIYEQIKLHFIKPSKNIYFYKKKHIIDTFIINNSKNNNINELRNFLIKNCPKYKEKLIKLTDNCLINLIPYIYIKEMLLYGNSTKKIYKNEVAISKISPRRV